MKKRPATHSLGVLHVGSLSGAIRASFPEDHESREGPTRARSAVHPPDTGTPGYPLPVTGGSDCAETFVRCDRSWRQSTSTFRSARRPSEPGRTLRRDPRPNRAASPHVRAPPGRVAGRDRTSAPSPGRRGLRIELAIAVRPPCDVVSIDRWINTAVRRARVPVKSAGGSDARAIRMQRAP